jgi:hypothetical protein
MLVGETEALLRKTAEENVLKATKFTLEGVFFLFHKIKEAVSDVWGRRSESLDQGWTKDGKVCRKEVRLFCLEMDGE